MEKRILNYSTAEIDEISVIATEMMHQEVAALGGINPPDITPGVVRNVLKAAGNKDFADDEIIYLKLLISDAAERFSMPIKAIRGDGFRELMALLREINETT